MWKVNNRGRHVGTAQTNLGHAREQVLDVRGDGTHHRQGLALAQVAIHLELLDAILLDDRKVQPRVLEVPRELACTG